MFDADIIKILDRYGTCCVKAISPTQLKRVEKTYGYNIILREPYVVDGGYVLIKGDVRVDRRKQRRKVQESSS